MLRKGLLALVAVGAIGLGLGMTNSAEADHCHRGGYGYRGGHGHHGYYGPSYRSSYYGGHHGHGHGYGYGPTVVRSYYGRGYSPYYGGYHGHSRYHGYGGGYRSGVSFSIGF